jgi:hypothetical protein
MTALPSQLNCLIIKYVINDPATIEHYLAIESEITERCLPIALRDLLNDYAIPSGLVPMRIPNATELLHYFDILWNDHTILQKFYTAYKKNYIYLLPYLLAMRAAEGLNQKMITEMTLEAELPILKLLYNPPKVNGDMMWLPAYADFYSLYRLLGMPPHESLPRLDIILKSDPDIAMIEFLLAMREKSGSVSPCVRERLSRYINATA